MVALPNFQLNRSSSSAAAGRLGCQSSLHLRASPILEQVPWYLFQDQGFRTAYCPADGVLLRLTSKFDTESGQGVSSILWKLPDGFFHTTGLASKVWKKVDHGSKLENKRSWRESDRLHQHCEQPAAEFSHRSQLENHFRVYNPHIEAWVTLVGHDPLFSVCWISTTFENNKNVTSSTAELVEPCESSNQELHFGTNPSF